MENFEQKALNKNENDSVPEITRDEQTSISQSNTGIRPFTDIGNAERLVSRYGDIIYYSPQMKRWYVYEGGRWKKDSGALIHRLGFNTVRDIALEAEVDGLTENEKSAILDWSKKSSCKARIAAMLDLARWYKNVAIDVDEFDTNPWLLNCENGTLELTSGLLLPCNPADLLTRKIKTSYDPEAQCPEWHAFLDKVMASDAEKIAMLQRMSGYFLTGITSEQCMFIMHGSGANGKSTYMEIMRDLLGEYAIHTAMSSLLGSSGLGIRNDIARMNRARLVTAVEVNMGKSLDESLIKQLTGGDQITARFLYREYFEFKPQFKIIIGANHKPDIQGVDHGIWRRIYIIPFDVIIPPGQIDKDLSDKLRAELPGILNWAIQGCRDWAQNGLQIPESIVAATQEYRREMDVVETFIEDKCTTGLEMREPIGNLYKEYEKWSNEVCQDPIGKKTFGKLMRQKGYIQIKSGNIRYWKGIELIG